MISICIPHYPYNDEINDICTESIRRLVEYTKVPYEIILAINGGVWYEVPDGPAVVLNYPDPIGNPSGWNVCLEQAIGDTIIFMDNDVWVEEGWAEPLIDLLKDPSIGIAIPDVERLDFDGKYHHTDNMQGCAIAMTRGTLEMLREPTELDPEPVYGFDSRFDPAYAEDTDLFLRVNLRGLRRCIASDSHVKHLSGQTCFNVFQDEIEGDVRGLQAVAVRSRRKYEDKWKHLGSHMGSDRTEQLQCWRLWQ